MGYLRRFISAGKYEKVAGIILLLIAAYTAIMAFKSFNTEMLNKEELDKALQSTNGNVEEATYDPAYSSVNPDEILNNAAGIINMENSTGSINITEMTYLTWMKKLYEAPDKYKDRTVSVTGFIYRNEDRPDNEFVAAREQVTIGEDSTETVGILCRYDEAAQFNEGDWVKLQGSVDEITFNGVVTPVINVTDINKVDKPENEYIYAD